MVRAVGIGSFLLMLVSLSIPAVSEASHPRSVHLGMSHHFGRAFELVYADSYQEVLLSELLWDIPSTISADVKISYPVGKSTVLTVSAASAWLSLPGEMTDTDYFSPDSSTVSDEYPFKHWSRSDAYILAASIAELRITEQQGRFLGFHGGFEYQFWEWSDAAWEYIYFRDSLNGYEYGTFDGKNAVDYRQHFFIPYVGLSTSYTAGSIKLEHSLSFSPSVIAYATDDHHLRDPPIRFEDFAPKGMYLSLESSLGKQLGDTIGITVTCRARWIPAARADTRLSQEGSTPVFIPQQAAIGSRYITFGISLQYFF